MLLGLPFPIITIYSVKTELECYCDSYSRGGVDLKNSKEVYDYIQGPNIWLAYTAILHSNLID